MSPLEQLRAEQHDTVQEPSDAALAAFLAAQDIQTVRLDLAPHSAQEARMLGRSTAA